MTLIDGDRIITAQLYDDEYEEFTEKKMSIIDYVNAYTDEGVTESDVVEQTSWIPVNERYPTDTNKDYLVCYEDGCITIEYLYINDDGYPFFSGMELGVMAWMPLPEPYKQEVKE